MKKNLSFILLALLTGASLFAQSVLPNDVLLRVRSSVFEVVVDKNEDTTITYEKKLPMDRIPFAIRNDKYTPIGTAFLLDDGSFMSAAHVITLYGDSYKNNYYLRDSDGETYKIDEITSFSNSRDFISFTVPDYKIQEAQGLTRNENAKMNTNVFSVGNALGEGIIIRNGILTSRTYEVENGEWQWLRFSAAASPGNSGGPLINENGEVIGIITMKSENENLNYALPIAEIKNVEKNKGFIKSSIYYSLPNVLNEKNLDDFEYTVNLPMKYNELHAKLTEEYKNFIKTSFNKMKEDFNPQGPKGLGSSRNWPDFSFYSYSPSFPYAIYKDDSGDWDLGNNNTKSYNLKDNGNIIYTSMMGYVTAMINKPDSVALADLVASPKMYMDYLLEAYKLHRTVGTEQIAVTSFGNPSQTDNYTDFFGRNWKVSYFDVKFADAMIVCYALPTPTGVFLMYKLDTVDDIKASHYLDLQFAADSIYIDMYGKVKNWKEYLALPESITGKKTDIAKDFSMELTDEYFKFYAETYDVNLPASVFKIDDETTIDVIPSLTKNSTGKVVQEIKGLLIFSSKKADGYKYFGFKKYSKPEEGADNQITQSWDQIKNRVSPYDGQPYNNDQYTYRDESFTVTDNENPDAVYVIISELKNQNRFDEINEFSEQIKASVKIK